jgi:hypothetical protein
MIGMVGMGIKVCHKILSNKILLDKGRILIYNGFYWNDFCAVGESGRWRRV